MAKKNGKKVTQVDFKKPRTNVFGCPIGIPLTQANVRARCKILEKGIESGKWKGAKLALAKYHLNHYRSLARSLNRAA